MSGPVSAAPSAHYGEWSPERSPWLGGLTGTAWMVVIIAGLPELVAINNHAWAWMGLWLGVWVLATAGVAVPVRGRVAAVWVKDVVLHQIGGAMGWSVWRSRAASGEVEDPQQADLPGVLAGVRVHDGPPYGPMLVRTALVQHLAHQTWCVVARIAHPGIGMAEPGHRDLMGEGLAGLLEGAVTSDLVSVIALQVRTVPDDGAERRAWQRQNLRADAPPLALRIDQELSASGQGAGVRKEAWVSVVIPDSKIARQARAAGGGSDGIGRVLASLMNEIESTLTGSIGCTRVDWLDSAELSRAIRTGFAPAERAGLMDAALSSAYQLPIAAAGPMQAPASPARHYVHDAWSSISYTLMLPQRGAVMGALAPVMAPATAGERRCLTIFYSPIDARHADRLVGRASMSATTAAATRDRMGFASRAAHHRDAARVADTDEQLAGGRALIRAAAVASVTVPSTWPVEDHGRRLEASVRASGFTPLRLDLAQDTGFVAAAIPLGIGLPPRKRL
jgi:hypothetical protein